MFWFQKLSVRTLLHVVAVASVLQCLSASSYCCVNGKAECGDTRKACCVDVSFGTCNQVAWRCILDSHARCQGGIQNSTEYGCDHPCCSGSDPHTCKKIQLETSRNCRKKPTGPVRRWHSGAHVELDFPPTSRFVGGIGRAPSTISTAARCSLLCRFLL